MEPETKMTENTATLPAMTRGERNRRVLYTVATRCVVRVAALGLKGKRADNEALAFFAGACGGIEATQAAGQDEGDYKAVALALMMIVAVRGMMGVRQIVSENAAAAEVQS